jgi:hypothetical protein
MLNSLVNSMYSIEIEIAHTCNVIVVAARVTGAVLVM